MGAAKLKTSFMSHALQKFLPITYYGLGTVLPVEFRLFCTCLIPIAACVYTRLTLSLLLEDSC